MNIFSRIHTLRGLYEQNKALLTALEVMEEELNEQIEKLQDENEYLKDELSYSRVRNNRLDEEIKTVRERDFKDIYPGLQAEIESLQDELVQTRKNARDYLIEDICDAELLKACETCETKGNEAVNPSCPLRKDEVPTETTSEDS